MGGELEIEFFDLRKSESQFEVILIIGQVQRSIWTWAALFIVDAQDL